MMGVEGGMEPWAREHCDTIQKQFFMLCCAYYNVYSIEMFDRIQKQFFVVYTMHIVSIEMFNRIQKQFFMLCCAYYSVPRAVAQNITGYVHWCKCHLEGQDQTILQW